MNYRGWTEKFVEMPVLSGNKFVNLLPRYRYVYRVYRDAWYRALVLYFSYRVDRPEVKRRVDIYRIIPPKCQEFDDENFSTGAKPIFDHLQKWNWIRNDNRKWCEREYFQLRFKEAAKQWPGIKPGTVIRVYYE